MAWMELRILVLARSFVYPFASFRSLAEVSVLGGQILAQFLSSQSRLLVTHVGQKIQRYPRRDGIIAFVYNIRHPSATETCYPFAARIIKFSICGAC
jgi:hypothetical protein